MRLDVKILSQNNENGNRASSDLSQVNNKQERRNYRTEIPNIVVDMKLKPRTLSLYVLMRRVAGESGVCWESTSTLAKNCHMSVGSVVSAKKELLKPRPELGGKGLIGRVGRKKSDWFKITDIWLPNYNCYKGNRKKDRSIVEGSIVESELSIVESDRSIVETKNKPRKKEHIEEGIEDLATSFQKSKTRRVSEDQRILNQERGSEKNPYVESQRELRGPSVVEPASSDEVVTSDLIPDSFYPDPLTGFDLPASRECRDMIRLLEEIGGGEFPNTNFERAALLRLCEKVDAGKFSVQQVIECAEWVLYGPTWANVTPSTIERNLNTFVTRQDNGVFDLT